MAIDRDVLVEYIKASFVGNVHHRAGEIVDFVSQSEGDQMAAIKAQASGLADALEVQKAAVDADSAALDVKITNLRNV